MINLDRIKKLLLIMVGILIVFGLNNFISSNDHTHPISNTYPIEPFSADLILITSAGQSTDAYIFHDMANDLHLTNHFMPEVNTYDLREYSSVVFVVGYSEVGMMLNEVTLNEELKRVKKIVQTAEAELLPVVTAYLGSNERRSVETDTLLKYLCSESDYILMTTDNANDPFIDTLTDNGAIPITCVNDVDQLSMPLASIFK